MQLIDRHNRVIKAARLSVTDRCNFRCTYCMPDGLINPLKRDEILSFEEIVRLIGILHTNGVNKIRLTGGEPTTRKNFINLCKMVSTAYPKIELAITTNGVTLPRIAQDLKNAGVHRLNISLDTLNHEKFHEITQKNEFENVMKGIEKAIKVGLTVKINAVSIKSFNDDEDSIKEFIDFSKKIGVQVRFIEMMPFTGNDWNKDKFLSSADLRDKFEQILPIHNVGRDEQSQTSKNYESEDGNVKLGFISSVSETFCENCDRIRFTVEGALRPCLHSKKEYPLRLLLRNGASDGEILKVIQMGLNEKWKEHPDFLSLNFLPPIDDREMIRIGG